MMSPGPRTVTFHLEYLTDWQWYVYPVGTQFTGSCYTSKWHMWCICSSAQKKSS
jgi:hypothetical protein